MEAVFALQLESQHVEGLACRADHRSPFVLEVDLRPDLREEVPPQ